MDSSNCPGYNFLPWRPGGLGFGRRRCPLSGLGTSVASRRGPLSGAAGFLRPGNQRRECDLLKGSSPLQGMASLAGPIARRSCWTRLQCHLTYSSAVGRTIVRSLLWVKPSCVLRRRAFSSPPGCRLANFGGSLEGWRSLVSQDQRESLNAMQVNSFTRDQDNQTSTILDQLRTCTGSPS